MIQSKRIGVLEFREASYIGNKPPFVSYDIVKWYPNLYYGKENDGAYQIIDEECDISIDLCNPYCYIGMQRKG